MTGMFIVSLRANNRRQFFSVPMYQEGSSVSGSGRVSTSGPDFYFLPGKGMRWNCAERSLFQTSWLIISRNNNNNNNLWPPISPVSSFVVCREPFYSTILFIIDWNFKPFLNRMINLDTINRFVFAIFREIDIKKKKKRERKGGRSILVTHSIQFSFFISFFAVSFAFRRFVFFKIQSFES